MKQVREGEKEMKKALFCIGLVAILLLTGFSAVSAIENKAVDIKEAGTVYGPFIAPSIFGTIILQEVPEYSSEFHIGDLYIYRDLKLTGIACGSGPQEPQDPQDFLYIRQFPFIGGRMIIYQGSAILTVKLYIGLQLTSYMIFMGHQGYGVTFEELQ